MTMHSALARTAAAALVLALVATGCGSNSSDTESYCERIRELGELDLTFTGDPSTLERAARELDGLVEVSPDEIRGSVEVLADALDSMTNAARQAGDTESERVDAALGALTPIASQVEEASTVVEAYTQQECQYSLQDESPDGSG
jgi:hypothetical protein